MVSRLATASEKPICTFETKLTVISFRICGPGRFRKFNSKEAGAAAVATQKLFAEEKLFERARSMEPHFEAALHSLRGARHVIDIRNIGLVGGVELEPRAGAPGRRAVDAHIKCFEAGVLVRFTADILALSPPLIIERAQIERIVETIRTVLKTLE